MIKALHTITLANAMGPVNCYLLKTEKGFVLVDTGWTNRRKQLEDELARAGCTTENLHLIFLTHGDFDHIGNCRYISQKYNAPVAMSAHDLGMAKDGDMFFNRKAGGRFMRWIARLLFRLKKEDTFTPDLLLEEDFSLSDYGIDGNVVHLPGHSLGSMGILLKDGRLLCGDLFENRKKPQLSDIMDDKTAATASVEKLKQLKVTTVYPGHGSPFDLKELLE